MHQLVVVGRSVGRRLLLLAVADLVKLVVGCLEPSEEGSLATRVPPKRGEAQAPASSWPNGQLGLAKLPIFGASFDDGSSRTCCCRNLRTRETQDLQVSERASEQTTA